MGYRVNEYNDTSLYDRVKKLLVSDKWSDCCFSVSGKDFKAHKLIMGISSPVFEAMFYGPLSTSDDIVITDIEPEIFDLLLNYIYIDKLEIPSIDVAFQLLYASKKYLLEHLSDLCISYIESNIIIDNVITVLNYPEYMSDPKLIASAMRLFCEHANYILQENKQIITIACIKSILENNQINISEVNLIKHVFNWTAQYCKQNNISNSLESRRSLLIHNGIYKLLRFSTLTLPELNEIISDKNNLILSDEIDLIEKISRTSNNLENTTVNNSSLPKRTPLKLHWNLCHRRPLKPVAPVVIDSNNYVMHSRLRANKSVFITSICVPTRMAPVLNFRSDVTKLYFEQISVSVICETDNSLVKFTNFMNTVGYDSMVNIDLSEPYYMKKDKWYKITFAWPENTCNTCTYVVEYRDNQYKNHKIRFEFEDIVSNAGSNGSFLSGLKYCL